MKFNIDLLLYAQKKEIKILSEDGMALCLSNDKKVVYLETILIPEDLLIDNEIYEMIDGKKISTIHVLEDNRKFGIIPINNEYRKKEYISCDNEKLTMESILLQ